MKTEPLYLSDPYLKNQTGCKILEIGNICNETCIILDRTIFYPMGGGQATDQGNILFSDGEVAEIYQVLLKDGEICHYLRTNRELILEDIVDLEINWERRFKNMKLHTAGHIIDFAMFTLGLTPTRLVPLKADHNKDPYIMYGGIINDTGVGDDIFISELQAKTNDLIQKDLLFSWQFVDYDTLKSKAIYLQPNLPVNKPLRMLELEGIGAVADGGTILSKTSEVGEIIITSIDMVDGNTYIRYNIK